MGKSKLLAYDILTLVIIINQLINSNNNGNLERWLVSDALIRLGLLLLQNQTCKTDWQLSNTIISIPDTF